MEFILAHPFKQTVTNVDTAGVVMENVLCEIQPLNGEIGIDEFKLLKKRCKR